MILNAHSYFSFRYGTLSPEALLELYRIEAYDCATLTDINSTAATLNFIRLAQSKGVKPVIGIDFREGVRQHFVGLARNETGMGELNHFLSTVRHQKEPMPQRAPLWENAYAIYPFPQAEEVTLQEHEYIGVRPSDLIRLKFSSWRFRQEKLVILAPVTFRNQRDFNAHRLLRAIDQNTLLSKLPKSEEGKLEERMLAKHELLSLYAEWPALIANTERLLNNCNVSFDFGEDAPHRNRATFTGSEAEDWEMIRSLCEEGMRYRYPEASAAIHERMENELRVIRQKGFLSYFLISWKIVNYARHKGYAYVGRGSGANSMVAYLLRITDVDPIDLDLYFERFINLFRKNPPDFDIDFSWKDRPDVTREIFREFGHEHTALLGTHSTFQYRAVVRELGKVFGLPKSEIDELAEGKKYKHTPDSLGKLVLKYGKLIQDFPSHLSIHAGGIIISENPIWKYTATDLPPKGFPTTHFDMVTAEDAGLYKFDILGQRGLGKIKDALNLVRINQPQEPAIDIHDIPRFKEDRSIKNLLRVGKTIGCFYVESPAMRMLLTKLQVEDYLGLVAASSIIRPGVSKSGMMREYIKRFRDPEERKKAHPVLRDIMPETFGVMVYQEDVIKVAHYFADLTLGEADSLRRGMSGKYRSREEFLKVKQKFFSNCHEKGRSPELALDVWNQIESFAGYAFAKGHSASYAVESYQSLFLKAYYPLEYMVATVNNGGGFYRVELYLNEARQCGGIVHAPCINHSGALTILYGRDIYIGFVFIADMHEKLAVQIEEERARNGNFESLTDFVERMPVTLDDIENLIRIDAFRFTGESKRKLIWQAHMLLGKGRNEPRSEQLFRVPTREYEIPDLTSTPLEDLFDQMEILGFPLGDPWLLLQEPSTVTTLAADIPENLGNPITIQGYLMHIKNTRTSDGKHMHFGTFLDRQGQWIDTVHFPPVARQFPFRGYGIYTVQGVVSEEFGAYHIEVTEMKLEPYMPDPRYASDSQRYQAPYVPKRRGRSRDVM